MGGGVLLLVPWVLVTGSLAYNELVVVGLGAVALVVLLGGGEGEGPGTMSPGFVEGGGGTRWGEGSMMRRWWGCWWGRR